MRKLFIYLLLLGSFYTKAWASDEFKTEYIVKYEMLPEGETLVTQDIRITNLKDAVVATNYTINVKQMNIYNVEASDEKGKMEISQETKDDTTTIKATFNDHVVGKGRVNKLVLKYTTKDIVAKVGEIYTIKIPKIADLEQVRTYDVEMAIPESYGPNIFITPKAHERVSENNYTIYSFDKESLTNKGISANFGKYQILNYKLIYQLENNSVLPNIHEITLPPDVKERQQINHRILSPEPFNVYQDLDGNLIAQYKLKNQEKLEIELTGTVRILGKQIKPEYGGKFEEIPLKLVEEYTREQKYWQVSNIEIQTLKNKLYEPELNVSQNAEKIYNYVVQTLDYDFTVASKDYLQRKGAVGALANPTQAACMEFTDLFITVARSMGIPARELNGYAININDNLNLPLSIRLKSGDLLHAWPEYYDPNFGWVPVDPTWGNTSKLDFFTKLDSTHLIFTIKGKSSEYPLPAGLYRTDETKKLVFIDISQLEEENDFNYEVKLFKKVNLNLLQVFKGNKKYIAKNTGGTYVYNLEKYNLLPRQVKKVFLNKNIKTLNFENLNEEFIQTKIEYLRKNPKQYWFGPLYIIFSILLGIALYSFLYFLIIVKEFPKKLSFRRKRRPQDQDHKYSQRLK